MSRVRAEPGRLRANAVRGTRMIAGYRLIGYRCHVRSGMAVHAGAVSFEGKGLVLPAPIDSGKTRVTAGLVAAGLSYLSDEAALIAPVTGELLAYPKPLGSLRGRSPQSTGSTPG